MTSPGIVRPLKLDGHQTYQSRQHSCLYELFGERVVTAAGRSLADMSNSGGSKASTLISEDSLHSSLKLISPATNVGRGFRMRLHVGIKLRISGG